MNRYVTTNVNHVGFKNRSVARFTWIFSPMLKGYLITYASKKGAVNRRSLLLSLFVLLISASIASCSSSGGGDNSDQRCNEANSDFISLPYTSSSLQLTNSDDRDCFTFTLSTERTVTISTSTAGFTDTVGRLYDSSVSLIEENDDDGINNNFEISRTLSAGTYYVEVSGFLGSTGPYTLNVAYDSFSPPPPSSCQSGGSTSISSIPYTSSGFSLSSSQDIDCFSFTLSTESTVTISTTGSTDTVGQLYTSSGSLIASNDDGGSSQNFLIERTLSAGTYYIEVTPHGISSGGSYTLRVTQPFPDSACSLTSISSIPYATAGHTLSPAGDRDCFSFTLSTRRTVTISTVGSINTVGRLYTSSGTLIESDDNDGSGSNFLISRTLNAGTYYVEASAVSSSVTGSYTLNVAYASLPISCQSGNFASISIPYRSSGLRLSSSQDRDCFRFTLSRSRTVNISTTSSIDTVGQLYTSSGSLIERDDDGGSNRNFLIERTLSAGTYYVEVSPFSSSTIGSYTLNVVYLGTLSHVTRVQDTSSLNLNGAHYVATAVVSGTTYLFVSGYNDNGVSVFRVNSGGSLTNVYNVQGISEARELDTAVIRGSTYLYVTAGSVGRVYVYRVNSGGTLTSIGSSSINHLGGAARGLITVTVGSNTYGYVTSLSNDKLAGILLSSGSPFQVLTEQLYSDTDNSLYELDGALGLATAVVGGNTYLYVTGFVDDGITVFRVPSVSTQGLTYIARYSDTTALELDGAYSATSAYIGGTPYLFVAGDLDDGVSIFRINNGGTLSHVSRITDTSSRALDGAVAVTTAVLSGNTYLFVGGYEDDGISVFRISSSGSATHITTVFDTSSYELNGVLDITTAVVGGNLYLFAAGGDDNGVSVFRVNP